MVLLANWVFHLNGFMLEYGSAQMFACEIVLMIAMFDKENVK